MERGSAGTPGWYSCESERCESEIGELPYANGNGGGAGRDALQMYCTVDRCRFGTVKDRPDKAKRDAAAVRPILSALLPLKYNTIRRQH